jgi:hypothetical protein
MMLNFLLNSIDMAQKFMLLPLLTTLFTAWAHAQPILQANVLPQIGDSYQIAAADTFGISEGFAGSNQNWNLSTLSPIGDTQRIQYHIVAPGGTPYVTNFPTANVSTKIDADTVRYAYFRAQSDQLSFWGTASLGLKQVYSDPDVRLKFPTHFNESSLDTFNYTTDFGAGIVTKTKGLRTTTYDGYGSLTTPLGTFPNAMRIKSVAAYADTLSIGPAQLINHHELTTYAWLLPEHPDYVAGIYYITSLMEIRVPEADPVFIQGPVIKTVSYISETSVGVKGLTPPVEGISALTLAPVPANDCLTLRFRAANAKENLQVRLTDAFGRMLQTIPAVCTPGDNEIPVALDHLPAGAYFLALTDGRGVLAVPFSRVSR